MEYVKDVNRLFSIVKRHNKSEKQLVIENTTKVFATDKTKEVCRKGFVEVDIPIDYDLLKKRLSRDIEVLKIVLEKILVSSNEQLIADITKHKISTRFQDLLENFDKYKEKDLQYLNVTERKDLNEVTIEIKCIHDQVTSLMVANKLPKVLKTPNFIASAVINAQRICSALNTTKEYETEMGKIEIEFPSKHELFSNGFLMNVQVLGTILERISFSDNKDLLMDLEKYQVRKNLDIISTYLSKLKEEGFYLSDAESKNFDTIVREISWINEDTNVLLLANLISTPISTRL